MGVDIYEALARTAQLFRVDVFQSSPAQDHLIVDGLRATTARIVADRLDVASASGQTALVTLYAQLAMMGFQVELDVPTVRLTGPQPPLRDLELAAGLVDYSDDLLPGGSSRPGTSPDVTFVLGEALHPGPHIRLSGSDTRALVGSQGAPSFRWTGDRPFGAIAAAAAAAAEGARAAVPLIAERLGVEPPALPAWRLSPERHVEIDLAGWFSPSPRQPQRVDVVSGGAITNATIFTLLREPGVELDLRVIEPELLDLSNLNRYALARRSAVGAMKTEMLATYQSSAISIRGEQVRVCRTTVPSLRPWAERVIVGVDDIPSRWMTQEEASDSWLGVGSTSHDYALVSEHLPGHACAGCTHPRPDNSPGPIPTIGFVSLWAGLALALKLLASGDAVSSNGVHIWPLGLEYPRGLHRYVQAPVRECPVRCASARSLSAKDGNPKMQRN